MIVYCCSDLIFATKIRSTADSLGIASRPARNGKMLTDRLDQVDDGKTNDPVVGVLVDMDLGATALELIKLVKSRESGPPVVAFGAHVATELLAGATQQGADFVMPRGAFTAQLPAILERLGK